LFDVGDTCKHVCIVLEGVVDIVISDGFRNTTILDVLGKGSVLGQSYVISKEKWFYKAVNNSILTAKIIQIDMKII